jgi:ABC-type amino acid transport system permease subunit
MLTYRFFCVTLGHLVVEALMKRFLDGVDTTLMAVFFAMPLPGLFGLVPNAARAGLADWTAAVVATGYVAIYLLFLLVATSRPQRLARGLVTPEVELRGRDAGGATQIARGEDGARAGR